MVQRINTIEAVLKKKKSVLVLGPRGSGKTYFVNHLLESFPNKLKIDLLDGALYRRYLTKPEQLGKDIEYQLNHDVLYVFIDEVQTIPQLLNEVHRMIELYKGRCVFILTGSSARKLKRHDMNLLAGRALFFPFYPFNSSEIDAQKYVSKILQFGTLPEVFLEKDIDLIKKYLLTYCHVYLKEEILQENELNYRLYHYRTNHGIEIDLILQKNIRSDPVAVEVKSGSNPGISDVKQFRTLKDDYPNAKCVVLCSTPFPYQDNGIQFLPYKDGIKEIFK